MLCVMSGVTVEPQGRHDVQQPGPDDVPGPCCVVGSLSKVIISSILTYVLIEIQEKIKMTMTMNGYG